MLRLEKYNEHINDSICELEDKARDQLKAMALAHPNTTDCFNIVKDIERRLWERKPEDADFMSLRIGSGTIDLSTQIRIPRTEISVTVKQKSPCFGKQKSLVFH